MRVPRVRFTVRQMMVAIALSATFTYYIAIPAWDYFRLPPKTRLILWKLRTPVGLPINRPMPLDEFLKALKIASVGPKDNGIPIYVDPYGLLEVGATMESTVAATINRRPIKEQLKRSLQALGLDYFVKDGLLTVTSAKATERALQDHTKDAKSP